MATARFQEMSGLILSVFPSSTLGGGNVAFILHICFGNNVVCQLPLSVEPESVKSLENGRMVGFGWKSSLACFFPYSESTFRSQMQYQYSLAFSRGRLCNPWKARAGALHININQRELPSILDLAPRIGRRKWRKCTL